MGPTYKSADDHAEAELSVGDPVGPDVGNARHTNEIVVKELQSALRANGADGTSCLVMPMPNSKSSAALLPSQQALSRSLPEGFALFADGLYQLPTKETAEPVFICSPMRVEAMFSDHEGKGCGRLVSVKSGNDRWHEIPVTSSDLLRRPTEVVATLVNHGLELSGDRQAKELLLKLLRVWKPAERLQTVESMGWVNDSYVSYVIGATVIGRAGVLPPHTGRGIGSGLVIIGSANDWMR